MDTRDGLLAELCTLIGRHARPDHRTAVEGLLVSQTGRMPAHYSLTEPLFVLMAQGGKRLVLGEHRYEYGAGECLVVTASMPVTGEYLGLSAERPALAMGLVLRPAAIAPLLLEAGARPARPGRPARGVVPGSALAEGPTPPAMATGPADLALLDAVTRLVRLLDAPADVPVLAPLLEREILWRILTGPHGPVLRQIGLAGSGLSHVSRAIRWIRDNYAEPLAVADLAALAGLSPSAFHRHFRAVTHLSPLQYQKRLRLQEARTLLASHPGDVAGVGHLVGYDSPTQFNREYRRLFGEPPGRDAARLRSGEDTPAAVSSLP